MMVRSMIMGPVIAVLALTGLTFGQSSKSNTPSTPGATDSNRVFITIQEPEKPSMKARVVKTWYLADGSRAFQVQTLISGEMLTIVEMATGNHSQFSKNLPIQAVATRIYHWGGPVCPPGVPVPPAQDSHEIIPVQAVSKPVVPDSGLTSQPVSRPGRLGSRLFGKTAPDCDCSPTQTTTLAENSGHTTMQAVEITTNPIKQVASTSVDEHASGVIKPATPIGSVPLTSSPVLVSQVKTIDCTCDEVVKPVRMVQSVVPTTGEQPKKIEETKKPGTAAGDTKASAPATPVVKDKPSVVKVVYVPAPPIVNVPGASQTTAGMAAGVVPNMGPTNTKPATQVVDKKDTKSVDKKVQSPAPNVTRETTTGPDGVITTRTITVTEVTPGTPNMTTDRPRGLFKGQIIGKIFGDKSKTEKVVVITDSAKSKPTTAPVVVKETPKIPVPTQPTTPSTPVVKKTEVTKPTNSIGQPTPSVIEPAKVPGKDSVVVKSPTTPTTTPTRTELKKETVSTPSTTQVARLDPVTPVVPVLPVNPKKPVTTPVVTSPSPDSLPATTVVAPGEKAKATSVPLADRAKPDPLIDLQNYVNIPNVEGKLIAPATTPDVKTQAKTAGSTNQTKVKTVKPVTPPGLEVKAPEKTPAADSAKPVSPVVPKSAPVTKAKEVVAATSTTTVMATPVPPAPPSPPLNPPVVTQTGAVTTSPMEKVPASPTLVSQPSGMSAPSGRYSILAAQAAASQVNNEGRRTPGSVAPVQISALEGNAFSPASAPQSMMVPQNNGAPVNNNYAQGSMYAPGNSGIQTAGGVMPAGYPYPQGGMPYGPSSGPYQGPGGPMNAPMPAPGFQKCCPIPSGYANAFTQAGNSRPIPADVNNDSPNTDNAFQSFQGATLAVPAQAPCGPNGCANQNCLTGIPVARGYTGTAVPATMTAQRSGTGEANGTGIVPVNYRIPTASLPTSPREAVSLPELFATLNNSLYPSQREMAVERISAFNWKVYPQVAEILLHAAQTDPAPMVRVACIRVLVQQQASTPYTLQALQMVKVNDKDARVRTEAESALNSLNRIAGSVVNDRQSSR